jgi:hypothetical protein
VSDGSKLYFSYSPSYEKLIIHSIVVHRKGKVIDKTGESKMSIIQREEGLESNIYSGDLTVNAILSDMRPGDIVEYDYSVIGDNPIFKNKFFYSFYLNGYYDLKEVHHRIIKPIGLELNIKYHNSHTEPSVEQEGNKEILTWHLQNVEGFESEASAPTWYDPYHKIELSEYFDWSEVIDWGKEVFSQKNEFKLPDDPELKEIAALTNEEQKIIRTLNYVQDEIRYFGIEIGVNSHKPNTAAGVIKNGYGDCKDKAILLCELLKAMDIKAHPMLVHTENRFALIDAIPSPSQFNHVVVSLKYKGKLIYLDPTISNQGGKLNGIYFPNYGYGLILKDSVTGLTYLSAKRISDIKLKEEFTIHSIEGKADLKVKTYYTGYEGDVVRNKFANSNLKDIEKKYKEFYESLFSNVSTKEKLKYSDDKETNLFVSTENYSIKRVWDKTSGDVLTGNFSGHFVREAMDEIDVSLETRKTPLYLSYPNKRVHIVEVNLPEDWDISYENETIKNRYIWYNRKITYVNRKLKLEYALHILRTEVEPADYASFKEDVDKIYNSLGYQISWNEKVSINTKNSNVNWLLVFLAFLFAVLASLGFIYLYKKLTAVTYHEVPVTIGGWLLLPVIGAFLSILFILYHLLTQSYFDKTVWMLRTDESSDSYLPGFGPVLVFELCLNIALMFYLILILVLVLKYNRHVPKLFIIYYIAYFFLTLLDDVLTMSVLHDKTALNVFNDVFRKLVACAIWIPYFVVSKRVKETFVN